MKNPGHSSISFTLSFFWLAPKRALFWRETLHCSDHVARTSRCAMALLVEIRQYLLKLRIGIFISLINSLIFEELRTNNNLFLQKSPIFLKSQVL